MKATHLWGQNRVWIENASDYNITVVIKCITEVTTKVACELGMSWSSSGGSVSVSHARSLIDKTGPEYHLEIRKGGKEEIFLGPYADYALVVCSCRGKGVNTFSKIVPKQYRLIIP